MTAVAPTQNQPEPSPPLNNQILSHDQTAPQSRAHPLHHQNDPTHNTMNPLPQPFAGPGRAQNGRGLQTRHSDEFRNAGPQGAPPAINGHGPMPVPAVPRGPVGNGQQDNMRGFAGARSPPSGRTTSHVPCKFFRQGACQAGKACPFLHSEAPTACKYFQKGNCKFGLKCANEHITADGRRVNKPNGYVMGGAGHLNLGGRVMPTQGPPPASSLLSMQQDHLVTQPQPIPGQAPLDYMNPDMWKKQPYDIPTVETTFSSHPNSNYGSPQNDGRLPMSPMQNGLSVLDAPLPASFDSQGISVFARNGPIAASVPSRFPLDSSPPSSSPNRPMESSALRNLHSSAFGDDHRNGKGSLASSPPAAADEPIGRRIMHSERFSRQPRMISASVGARPPLAINDEWDENFAFEEDLVPNSLHELLTPQEKMRRFSRSNADEDHRSALSGLGTPNESSSKVGSPSTASPSRFGAFFAGRQKDSTDSGASAFGHVGSPLRNSSLHPGASPSLRAVSRPVSGDVSPFVSSPPRQASMGMISQQLQRTRISSRASDTSETSQPLQHPGVARVASGSSVGSSPAPRHALDRAVSSSSVGREKIDEEPELFSMDDDLDRKKENWKRSSGSAWAQGSPFSLGKSSKASPTLGPIGGQRTTSSGQRDNPWNK